MEVGVESTRIGVVVGAGTEVKTGLIVMRDGGAAMRVKESSPIGKPGDVQAVQMIRMKRKIGDFIFVLLRSMFE
jgi:ribosomal protein L27